jgi:hypothetical protein
MSEYNELRYKYERIALLKERLAVYRNWAMKGCQRIYQFQTAGEKSTGETREHNNVGFSGADSFILSSFAEQINAGTFRGSKKQMDILFQKMPKYAKQLDGIAQERANG